MTRIKTSTIAISMIALSPALQISSLGTQYGYEQRREAWQGKGKRRKPKTK